jgi:hypothetical protein
MNTLRMKFYGSIFHENSILQRITFSSFFNITCSLYTMRISPMPLIFRRLFMKVPSNAVDFVKAITSACNCRFSVPAISISSAHKPSGKTTCKSFKRLVKLFFSQNIVHSFSKLASVNPFFQNTC